MQAKQTSTEVRTVEGTLEALCDTWNIHDMDGIAALFAVDADFVNVVGMRFKGRDEIATAHRELHKDRFANTRIKQLQYSVQYLSDSIALAHVRWEMTGDPAAGANGLRRGTMSHVLVRKNGEWRFRATQNTDIVHMPEMAGHPFWSKYL
jgi:uncharacterized protein (TIGR02246 family)